MFVKRWKPETWGRAFVCLALLCGACAPSGATPNASQAPEPRRATEKPAKQAESHAKADQGGAIEPEGSPAEGAVDASGASAYPEDAPTPMNVPFEDKVPVRSVVTPACVDPGGTVTVEVNTKPEAAVAYSAVYAGNKSGAETPFGYGHGGNDKGLASKSGRYQSTWVVRIDAPRGPARLDVVVGYRGKFGYDDPHFAVADKNGNCPKAWLADEGNAD